MVIISQSKDNIKNICILARKGLEHLKEETDILKETLKSDEYLRENVNIKYLEEHIEKLTNSYKKICGDIDAW